MNAPPRDRAHVLRELGFTIRPDGDRLRGSATIVPEMHVPGTDTLRISVLATWVDTMTGLLTARFIGPRVPVTLGLDVHLYRPPTGVGAVVATAEVVKVGSEVVVASVDIADEDDVPVGTGTGLFMVARDPELHLPASADELVAAMAEADGPLRTPLADRAGCERREPGVAVLPRPTTGSTRRTPSTVGSSPCWSRRPRCRPTPAARCR
ncbi:MAG: hotdog domain-containing protein [Acidimicrobiales bacterium]|nr:hotdog domain-containing protein [Acidimicrobiales bacterium]